MTRRSLSRIVVFGHPFCLGGPVLPGGRYEVVAEEAAIAGLSFEAWRRTALHLVVHGSGRTEMRPIDEEALARALANDRIGGATPVEGAPAPGGPEG